MTQEPLLASGDDFDPQTEQEPEGYLSKPIPPDQSVFGEIVLRTVVNNDDGEWAEILVKNIDRKDALDDFEYITQFMASKLGLTMARPTTTVVGPHNVPPEPSRQGQPSTPRGNGKRRDDRGILEIEWMQVVAKDDDTTFLKVKPKVFEWPIPDHRKPENLVKLFDPDLKVTEEFLSTPQDKPIKPHNTTYVYFVKEGKYRNISRISYEYDENFLNE